MYFKNNLRVYQDWNKKISIRKLTDPMTNLPFPAPIPRSAFPASTDRNAESIFVGWAATATTHAQRQRAQILGVFNQFGTTPQSYPYFQGFGQASSFGQGIGASPTSKFSYEQSNAQMIAIIQQVDEEKQKALLNTAGKYLVKGMVHSLVHGAISGSLC